MSIEPEPSPEDKTISLAKLATIFAITFCVAFGLCTVSFGAGSNGRSILIPTALVIEAVCVLGLLVVGIVAIVRSFMK